LAATYELFYRAHRNGKPAIKKTGTIAKVILGSGSHRNLQSRVRLFQYDETGPRSGKIASSLYPRCGRPQTSTDFDG